MEETGFTVRSYSNPRIYDVFVREELKNFMVHHVMALYDVEMNEEAPQVNISEVVSDGTNDSFGCVWKIIQEIISSLESQSRIIRISRTGQDLLHELEGE